VAATAATTTARERAMRATVSSSRDGHRGGGAEDGSRRPSAGARGRRA